MPKRAAILALVLPAFLVGCQSHLPPLETSPDYPGPTITDITSNITCELAGIVNAPDEKENEYPLRLAQRIEAYQKSYGKNLIDKIKNLQTYNFVASVQLTLEVTDTEGFTPSLSVIMPFHSSMTSNRTYSVGGSANGTEDRSVTLNYSVDLSTLATKDWNEKFCSPKFPNNKGSELLTDAGLTGSLAGDLGMADIISDGLISLDDTQKQNVYTSAGMTATPNTAAPKLNGVVVNGDHPKGFAISDFNGTIAVTPPTAGSVSPATLGMTGSVYLQSNEHKSERQYLVNLTGIANAPNLLGKSTVALSGTLSFMGDATNDKSDAIQQLGINPTVSLAGTAEDDYKTLNLTGVLSPANTVPPPAAGAPPIKSFEITLEPNPPGTNDAMLAAAPGGGAKGATGGASSQGTSFGSLVDFIISYGLNGGPSWTVTTFKAGSGGSGGMLSVNRMNTDSMSITFAASCKDGGGKNPATTYWDSIGPCDAFGVAKQKSFDLGFQLNQLMNLNRTLNLHPAATQ